MSIFFILTLLIEIGASALTKSTKKSLRVYAGQEDVTGEFDFTVLLQHIYPQIRFCTGSLLSATWVLTSAHCIVAGHLSDMAVRYGDYTTYDTNKVVRVTKLFPHPNFSYIHGFNDIGLVLTEKIDGVPVVKLLAIDYKALFGLAVTYAGYGRITRDYVPMDQNTLMEEQLTPLQVGRGLIIPCESYESFKYTTLCVAPTCANPMQQVRSGDAGGPMMYDGRLVGIERSFVKKDNIAISQYTPVCLYIPWIKHIMSSEEPPSTTPTF